MKLLYIQDRLGLGGISSVESVKENWLVSNGYDVANIFTHYEMMPIMKQRYDNRIKIVGISLAMRRRVLAIPLAGRFLWYVYFRLLFLIHILKLNPDIIISTHPNLEPVTVVLSTFWKKRIIEHHISGVLQGDNIRTWIIKNIKMRFYTQVCLTKGDADEKSVYYHKRAIVIPNLFKGTDIEPSLCQNKKVIIPARFVEQKGIKPFLPYWKIIEASHPDWELHLFGEGEEKNDIVHIIQENGYKTVFVHPFSSQVLKEIASCSILLLPSLYEGFGMTLVEAMFCGVPCIAFDCKYGPSDIINDGEDGYVVEYLNYDCFIERIDRLMNDESLRCNMGSIARVNIQRYSIDTVMPLWVKLFAK